MKSKSLIFFFLFISLASCKSFEGPCDIYEQNGTPAVAAHSTTRRLYSKYKGPLYQLTRESDSKTLDIPFTKKGYADVKKHEEFTKGKLCYISIIYDQSGMGNDLLQAAPGTFKGPAKGDFNTLSLSDMAPVVINGHKAYGLYIMPGMGYRNNNARGLAIGDEAEGIYSVVDGTHYSNGCCFDYGNASTNGVAVGTGTMETTYYGTATAWGRGNGEGPWIMSDFEAGLFSGYDHKLNDVPSIDSWRFVSIYVNGGDGNQWDLRGGDATKKELTTYYSGPRPHTPERSDYFPMDKRGAILLGNGGDNGNGSAGTFYEGVMTFGYPCDEAILAVQKNIADQKYAESRIEQSRLRSFKNSETQELTVTVHNTGSKPMTEYEVSLELPQGWGVEGELSYNVVGESLVPGAKRTFTFVILAPESESAAYITSYINWGRGNSDFAAQRVRSSAPIKINEVLLADATGTKSQFIELYNSSNHDVNISSWRLASRPNGKETTSLAVFPANSIIKSGEFLLARLAPSSITAPAKKGSRELHLSRDLASGTRVIIDGNEYKITKAGTPAATATNVFIEVSTGPWLNFDKKATNLPLASINGIESGHLLALDVDGPNFEIVKVKSANKAATQTYLAETAHIGDTIIKLQASANLSEGDIVKINTGDRLELKKVKRVISSVSAPLRRVYGADTSVHTPGEIELDSPLTKEHQAAVDVSSTGRGVDFEKGTKFPHRSGEIVQSLGTAYTLDTPLKSEVNIGDVVAVVDQSTDANILFNSELSQSSGAIILYAGDVVVDAIVYGSQQSNSSANGTIAAPEIATLEGDQNQGGCIAVLPQRPFRWSMRNETPKPEDMIIALERYPDGYDRDSLCEDFRGTKNPTPGEKNL